MLYRIYFLNALMLIKVDHKTPSINVLCFKAYIRLSVVGNKVCMVVKLALGVTHRYLLPCLLPLGRSETEARQGSSRAPA